MRTTTLRAALCAGGALPAALCALLAQTPARKTQPAKPAPAGAEATAPGQPKFKAIWEPVNVPHDLELTSIHFTSAEEGWVAGGKNAMAGGVILHTGNGGASWEIQIGDPESADRAYGQLRFLNAQLGWAAQSASGGDHRLLRTTDGKTWAPVGGVPEHRSDYQFVSRDVGFVTPGRRILRTLDGGRKWDTVLQCRVKAEIQGLTREVDCDIAKMHFPNPSLGFAISRGLDGNGGVVFAKTRDGGATWSTSVVLPGEACQEGAIHFFDENTGVIRTLNGKIFHTTDGGATWNEASGSAGGGRPAIGFADASVGWMMRYRTLLYTTNGGRSWVSREIPFPALVEAFSLVQRDRGYAAGEHGMVYRYRVVPVDYSAKGMLPAPAMPAR